jgi:hypothetical protein
MKVMKLKSRIYILGLLLIIVLGCTPKKIVTVPPNIDLRTYENIGIIEFSSNANNQLQRFTSQKFLQVIQSSQPGVRMLELGNEMQVLKSVQHHQLNLEAIQAIGKKYNVAALIVGHIEVTEIRPKVKLSTMLTSMSVKADIEASLGARLYETKSGVTIWTDLARGKKAVAHVNMISNGPASFDVSDPESAYGKLAIWLVQRITHDFRETYERI